MQQLFMREFVNQKLKLKYLLKADEIFYTLKKNMRTNIEIGDIRYFIKDIKILKPRNQWVHTAGIFQIYRRTVVLYI